MLRIALVLILLPACATSNKRNLWIVGGLAPVAFFHETVIHETAHVATAKAMIPGLEVTRFAPYPCRDDKGGFHFGYFSSTYPDNVRVGDNTHVAINISPYVVAASTFLLSDILLSSGAVRPEGPGGAVLYLFGMLAPFVDFATGFAMGRSDWPEIRRLSRQRVAFDLVGGTLLVVGAIRLVQHGHAVFRR